LALVLKLRFQQPPPAIQDGFGHPGFGKFQATDIPNVDLLISIDDPSRKLMERVAAAPGCPAMQALGFGLMASALRLADLLFQAPIELTGAQALGITRDRRVLQPQVNANVDFAGRRSLIRYFYRQTQVPVTHGILGK
jgi:hypothetical protein